MQMPRSWPWYVGLACSLILGCGTPKVEIAPVSGKVSYAGTPLTSGTIKFYTIEGKTATGTIGTDGSYTLTTAAQGDGAAVGKHKVTIFSYKAPAGINPSQLQGLAPGQLPPGMAAEREKNRILPAKYEDHTTTPLEVEVRPGQNTLDIDVPKE